MATKRIIEAGGLFPDGVLITQTGEKVAFLGATPVVQPADADQAAITDSSGGEADGTISAVSGSGADETINNNFAEVATLVNRLRADLVTLGLIKGSA
jgi:hypothetical protein